MSVGLGDYVKIVRNNERFWVQVTKINKKTMHGTIANDLQMNDMQFGDLIKFPIADIVDVSKK